MNHNRSSHDAARRGDALPVEDEIMLCLSNWVANGDVNDWIPPLSGVRFTLMTAVMGPDMHTNEKGVFTVLEDNRKHPDSEKIQREYIASRSQAFFTDGKPNDWLAFSLGGAIVGGALFETAAKRDKYIHVRSELPVEMREIDYPGLPQARLALYERVHPAMPDVLDGVNEKLFLGAERSRHGLYIGGHSSLALCEAEFEMQELEEAFGPQDKPED